MSHKARSRGKEAVQAAADAARLAAAAIASEKLPALVPDPAPTTNFEVISNVALLENNTPVLDLKGVFAIGTGPDEPIRSFMLLLLPTGQSVRVPYCPGNFVVSNENWSNITFPCWVMFNDSLKRDDELAVAVLDYSRVNPNLDLISIESLAQPIRVRNNVYKSDKDLRITSISSVKGFRGLCKTIEEGGIIGPWSEQYGPYKMLKIKNWQAVGEFCERPVRSRLPQLVALARAAADAVAVRSSVQDKRSADKDLALKMAHINKLEETLEKVNLESYDKDLDDRVAMFDASSTEQLRTPERGSISAGTARIVTTRFADVMIALDDAADEKAPAPAAAEDTGSGDDLRDVEDVDAEVDAEEAAAVAAPAAADSSDDPPTGKDGAQPMKRRAKPTKTLRYEPEKLAASKKSKKAQQQPPEQEPTNEQPLLNRDGVPYKRGGPYRPRRGKAGAAAAAADGGKDAEAGQPRPRGRPVNPQATATATAAGAASDAEILSLRERIAQLESSLETLRAENQVLEREKVSFELQVKLNQEKVELRIDSVKAKVAAEYQSMLHAQFMQGLATGSAMASQGAMQVPGVQPFSFGGGNAAATCPSARSAGLGSSFPHTMGSDL